MHPYFVFRRGGHLPFSAYPAAVNFSSVLPLWQDRVSAKSDFLILHKKSIENSIVFGVYTEDTKSLIGMARIVTDFATTFYLADVIIDEKYHGNGIGKKLISAIVSDKRFSSLLGILVTKDAHGLYEHFGFVKDCERAMTRRV